jgi:hypothetical protein
MARDFINEGGVPDLTMQATVLKKLLPHIPHLGETPTFNYNIVRGKYNSEGIDEISSEGVYWDLIEKTAIKLTDGRHTVSIKYFSPETFIINNSLPSYYVGDFCRSLVNYIKEQNPEAKVLVQVENKQNDKVSCGFCAELDAVFHIVKPEVSIRPDKVPADLIKEYKILFSALDDENPNSALTSEEIAEHQKEFTILMNEYVRNLEIQDQKSNIEPITFEFYILLHEIRRINQLIENLSSDRKVDNSQRIEELIKERALKQIKYEELKVSSLSHDQFESENTFLGKREIMVLHHDDEDDIGFGEPCSGGESEIMIDQFVPEYEGKINDSIYGEISCDKGELKGGAQVFGFLGNTSCSLSNASVNLNNLDKENDATSNRITASYQRNISNINSRQSFLETGRISNLTREEREKLINSPFLADGTKDLLMENNVDIMTILEEDVDVIEIMKDILRQVSQEMRFDRS